MKGQLAPRAASVAPAPAPSKRGEYPKGSTDNRLLMEAVHRLAPGPFKLYTVLLVRMAGKGVCYVRTAPTLMADLGAPERTIRRWLQDLIDQGFITTTRKGRARSCLTYRLVTGPQVQFVRPTGGSKRPKMAGQTGQKWPLSLEEPNEEGASRPTRTASEPEGPDLPTPTAKQFGAAILRDWRSRKDPTYQDPTEDETGEGRAEQETAADRAKREELEAGLARALTNYRDHRAGLDAAVEAIEAHEEELTLQYTAPPRADPPDLDPAVTLAVLEQAHDYWVIKKESDSA